MAGIYSPFPKGSTRPGRGRDLITSMKKLHYENNLNSLAKNLRKARNLSEVLLWNELKQRKLGYRFLRQRPIGNYIVDFYCSALRLVIEIDGAASHNAKLEQDAVRQKEIEKLGIRVLRFMDKDVRYNLSGVVGSIRNEIQKSPGSQARHPLF